MIALTFASVSTASSSWKSWTKGRWTCFFADPPFNIGYDYDAYGDAQSSKDYLCWYEQSRRCSSRLKPDGTFWLAIGDEHIDVSELDYRLAAFSIRQRSHNARDAATEKFGHWINERRKLLQISIDDSLELLETPGVFLSALKTSGFMQGKAKTCEAGLNKC